MSEQEVSRVATPVAVPELLAALRSAWATLFAEYPSEESLDLLAAHWGFETGWGHVGSWNFNLGNRKHVEGDGRDWFWLACTELENGVVKHLTPPNPGCRFCAFATLEDGAFDYLAMLHGTFSKSWPAVEAGDPRAFAQALKSQGYYTDTEVHYEAELVGCLAIVKRTVAAAPLPPNPDGGRILDIARGVDAGEEGPAPDSTPPEAA